MNLCAAICAGTMTVVVLESATGCKSVPTNDTMYMTSYAVGVATGLISNNTKIDNDTRNAICDIINIVRQCVPETNQTFEVAWMPIAVKHVEKLITEGKLNVAQGKMVITAFSLACQGIDYIFEIRYPSAKTYRDLVIAAIDGFADGFLTVFKPINGALASPATLQYDVEAYNWLKENARYR